MTQCFLQLEFPALALEAVGADYHSETVAVYGSQQIVQVSPLARSQGVLPGMTLSMALTLCPTLITRPSQPRQEARLLQQLALWAYQYTHQVAIRRGGLCLEVGHSEQLFGPPEALHAQLTQAAQDANRPMRLAFGSTPEMADLFLRQALCPMPADFESTCMQTPITALDLPPNLLRRLQQMGFRTLKDYCTVPSRARQKRVPQSAYDAIEAMLGHRRTPVHWFSPPTVFAQHLEFVRGLEDSSMLRFPMRRLSEAAMTWLRCRQSATDRFTWSLVREDRHVQHRPVSLNQPQWEADALFEPSWLSLESCTLQAPVTELHLRIQDLSPLRPERRDVFHKHLDQDRHLLLNRLKARLGPEAICTPVRIADPRPDKANQYRFDPTHSEAPPLPPRPPWLVHPAHALGSSPEHAGFQLLQGPERIESGWWDLAPTCRQYWIGKQQDRLAWIYQDQYSKHWWLAGWFS